MQYLSKYRIGTVKLAALGLLQASAVAALGVGELVWWDEFEAAGLPDGTKWRYDVGGDGWGNNEAQFYTEERLENARVENGVLVIEARKEPWPSARNPRNDYTSARLVSKGNGDWLYGRIEVRAKLPAGRGTWPAIWMLPTGNAYGGWPRSGEIDIMEHVGFDQGTVHGSLHALEHNWTTGTQPTGSVTVADAETAFHVYAVEWSPQRISFLIDGSEYFAADNPGTGWQEWPYDQPFYLILNVAVGGFWGGQQGIDPDIWPVRMEIDYVRVYDLGDTVPLDTDGDQLPNATDPDDDGDGLTDAEEHALGTNLLKVDTDGDGYSDFEEVQAGTNPLLLGSFPGSLASILMINNDFAVGADPWIIHTNKLDEAGNWLGQAGSWSGSYEVFDYVQAGAAGQITFANYRAGDAANAEHLLYQEWNSAIVDLLPGDVIRFRGTARASVLGEGIKAQAFIRVLDFAYMRMADTREIDLGTGDAAFELETILGDQPFNVLQAGISITAPQSAEVVITFSGLEATLNETTDWGFWPIQEDNNIDTGAWMGWLNVEHQPWVWSYSLAQWIYLPVDFITAGGSWMYIRK